MKPSIFIAILFWPGLVFAADQPSLADLDRVIMHVPPAPLKWQTNLTLLIAQAEKGDVNAETDLGLHYIFAVGTPQRLDEALHWLKKAADQDHPPAEYTLGLMCKSGVGVVSNQAAADVWFSKAAGQGYPPAKHEAALTLDRQGKRAEALKLLREAADNGFPSSEYLLGCVVTDPGESYFWFSLAAEAGLESASTRQLELRQQLTKDQLAKAEEHVREFKRKRADEAAAKK